MKSTILKIVLFFLMLLSFSMVTLLPFIYQSQTLWYKIGFDKTMLFAAQLVGLYSALLVFLQILLVARVPLLLRLYGVGRLQRLHRMNGTVIPVFVFLHIFLVLAPEGIANLPIGKKYWPEMLGAASYFGIVVLACSVWIRNQMKISYIWWKVFHRSLGVIVVLGVSVHIAYVSDSFANHLPLWGLVFFVVGVFSLFTRGRLINK